MRLQPSDAQVRILLGADFIKKNKRNLYKQKADYNKMKKRTLCRIVAALAITFNSGSYFPPPEPANEKVQDGAYDTFAKCITENGARLYGTSWCPPCKSQKEKFGSSFQYVNYTDCDEKPEECTKALVYAFPTWTFADGTSHRGGMLLDELAEKTRCELKKDTETPSNINR